MTAALSGDTTEYAWRVEQGERERLEIPVLDNGTPRDVTGWTVDAQIKTEPGGTVLYTFPASGIAIAGHLITLTVPAPVSAAWTWTVAWWRVVITEPNPDPLNPDSQRVIKGPFLVYRN
jgi:hypothetical protein